MMYALGLIPVDYQQTQGLQGVVSRHSPPAGGRGSETYARSALVAAGWAFATSPVRSFPARTFPDLEARSDHRFAGWITTT